MLKLSTTILWQGAAEGAGLQYVDVICAPLAVVDLLQDGKDLSGGSAGGSGCRFCAGAFRLCLQSGRSVDLGLGIGATLGSSAGRVRRLGRADRGRSDGAPWFQFQAAVAVRAGGLLGIPLGVGLLPRLDSDWFKAILGGVLALWCPAMLLSARLPRISAGGRLLDGVVGMAGGVMGGLGGFTGALPTLWCTLRGYDKDRQRVIIQNFNLAMLLVTMAVYVGSGIVTRQMLPMLIIVLPAMLLPTLFGTRIYAGLSEARFRQVVLVLLTASGLALLASALPKLCARLA